MKRPQNFCPEYLQGASFRIDQNRVVVRNAFGIKIGEAHCHPDDEFDISEGINVALNSVQKNKFAEGSKVRIKKGYENYCYTEYTKWLLRNLDDMEYITNFCYDHVPNKSFHGDTFKVVKIAPHTSDSNKMLAYIVTNDFCKCGFLYDLKALEVAE